MFSLRLSIFCVCLAAVVALSSVSAKTIEKQPVQPELREIKVVSNIQDFVSSHPGVKVISLKKERGLTRSQSVRYTIGARVSGDHLVAQSSDVYAYPQKKDVTIQLTYPESGTGSIVTYVEIICSQDNNEGNAYIIAGGVGSRFVSIIVEASQTENFSFSAQFYGSD